MIPPKLIPSITFQYTSQMSNRTYTSQGTVRSLCPENYLGYTNTHPQPLHKFSEFGHDREFVHNHSRMPKATPSKAELPKAPPKVRETKDASLFALRKAAYDAAYKQYETETKAYNAGQSERDRRKRKERAAASSAAAATSSSGAAETSSCTATAAVLSSRHDATDGPPSIRLRQLSHVNGYDEATTTWQVRSTTTKTKDKDVVVDHAMRSNDVSEHAVRHRPSGRRWPVWPLDHATA
jgi:hypothetical protein